MSTFYNPLSTTISNIPVLIYPMKSLEQVLDQEEVGCLEIHLEKLYANTPSLQEGAYHIVILWMDNQEVMTDVWMYQELETEDTGFTVDCKNFRSFTETIGEGITASDGLIMLGRETELAEDMRKDGDSIEDYIAAPRPLLPGSLETSENWYF